MKKVAIIQARMTSTRLPGKVLKEVLSKPLLEIQIERLKQAKYIDTIVIATTTNVTDDPIIKLCNHLGIQYFRGSEDDVLSRYYHAAVNNQADIVIRITSDCPVIDSRVVDKVINYYLENQSSYQYVSNSLNKTFPRGMDTEVFSFKSLEEAYTEAAITYQREHVTPFLYQNPERYHLSNYSYQENQSQHRWTVDTPEDFELIKRIIESLYPKDPYFTLEDTLKLLEEHPDWVEINAYIEQKKLGQ